MDRSEGAAGCLFGTVAAVTAPGTALLFVAFFIFGLDPLGCMTATVPSLSGAEEVSKVPGICVEAMSTAFGDL